MRPRITLNTFRRIARTEDAMMRSVMPRTAAADSTPLETPIIASTPRVAWRAGVRLFPAPLTYKMQEAANA